MNSTFNGNRAIRKSGGGIYLEGVNDLKIRAYIQGSRFHSNFAQEDGGGVKSLNIYQITPRSTAFISNVAHHAGGRVHAIVWMSFTCCPQITVHMTVLFYNLYDSKWLYIPACADKH